MALYGFDAFSPGEIAERVEQVGVRLVKKRFPSLADFSDRSAAAAGLPQVRAAGHLGHRLHSRSGHSVLAKL